ncbi:gp20 [Shigella phage Buco]|uniref:Putative membrane protein n=1 Tax=Shigella phage Buco TaxID=2530183 RepID=A0A482JLT4_9CAUD|nr:gp20 [Shigella phage Buco]QBP32920.1 putative membrane protein [Shigella phage Buco]
MSNKSNGIGLASVLGVVFVTLKLCGVINWSWVWVLAPWWLPLVLAVSLMASLGAVWAVLYSIKHLMRNTK